GQAGDSKVTKKTDEAYEYAKEILGKDIKGHTVHQLMIAEAADINEEYYFSLLMDRANRTNLSMASVEGGMDIEQLAEERPEDLARVEVSPTTGLNREVAEKIAAEAKFAPELQSDVADVLVTLGEVFEKEDATLVEVNPLVLTGEGKLVALDGKVTVDDNADFRQPAHAELVDERTENPLDRKSTRLNSSHVSISYA